MVEQLDEDVEFTRGVRAAAPPPEAMDLFAWSEMDAQRPLALGDKLTHAVERGLVVYCATPRQRRTARLLLYLHAARCCERRRVRPRRCRNER